MSYLHLFFIVNFTLRIYQSHGFLPLPIRKLIEIRNTVMDTNYSIKYTTHKGSLGPVSPLYKATRTDLNRSGKQHSSKLPIISSKLKPYNRNRYANGKTKLKNILPVSYSDSTADTTNTHHYDDVSNETVRYILITDDYSIEALPGLGVIGIKRTVNEKDVTRTFTKPVIGITRTVNEEIDITRTLPQYVIGITRTVGDIAPTHTLLRPSILHNKASLPIPKVSTDIGQNDKVTEASDTYYKTKDQEDERPSRVLYSGGNFLKATRTLTASVLGIPGAIKDLDSGEIGPIRVLIEDDTDLKPDYISFTNKPHKIAFFDITKASVEDDIIGDPPDDWIVASRTSPYDELYSVTRTSPRDGLDRVTRTSPRDGLNRVTRTSQYDGLSRVTRTSLYDGLSRVTRTSPHDELYSIIRPSQMSTGNRVFADRKKIHSNYYNDMEPFRILIDDDSNTKNEYNIESDFYEKDDFSSRKEIVPWSYDEFPETEDDTSVSSPRTSQMTTSTQESYDKESLSIESYSSLSLYPKWPAFTVRNYFAHLLGAHERNTARTFSLLTQAMPFEFSHLRSKNYKDVTKQIKHLTGAILSSRSRTTVHSKKKKSRRLKQKRKIPKKKVGWECYECGMQHTGFGQPECHNLFGKPSQGGRHLKKQSTKKCNGNPDCRNQCFKRFLDVGTTYEERGCRTYPPACGRSYASKKFMRLEYLLREHTDACVASPHAVLMPFSSTIQLYVRFHVCVCEGRKCNVASSIVSNWTILLSAILCCYLNRRFYNL